MILSRRKLIGGMGLLFAAPAIVRAGSLMPIKPIPGIDIVTNPYWNGMIRYSGYDVLNIRPEDVITAFDWASVAQTTVVSRRA